MLSELGITLILAENAIQWLPTACSYSRIQTTIAWHRFQWYYYKGIGCHKGAVSLITAIQCMIYGDETTFTYRKLFPKKTMQTPVHPRVTGSSLLGSTYSTQSFFIQPLEYVLMPLDREHPLWQAVCLHSHHAVSLKVDVLVTTA